MKKEITVNAPEGANVEIIGQNSDEADLYARQISEKERNKGIIKNQDLPRNQRDHALFTGYAPFTNPKFSVSIVVEHGGGGGKVAAPIARDILLYALNGALPSLQEYPAEERNKMNSIIYINNLFVDKISIDKANNNFLVNQLYCRLPQRFYRKPSRIYI